MNEKLLEKLSVVTEEEKNILSGGAIDKKLYTDAGDFTVKSGKISDAERLVDMRPHTRFSPFPKHRHNYIEMIYTCLGVTRHTVNGSDEIVLKAGDILLLGTNAVHEVAAASEKDIAVNFIIRPEFFTVTLGEAGYGNTVYDMIVKELTSDGDASFLLFGVSGVLPIQNLVENLIYSFLTEGDGNYAVRNTTMGLI
ncbi:MAG: cupin domain-containing protein, partial [Clostridia bacterium]|nr:cupin domain-containing protein [Clostridia bacterium]